MLTAQQKEMRRTGLGSSDSPVILGESEFRTEFDVYLDKAEGFEAGETPWQELGTLLEPVALELYRRRTGAELTYPGTLRHPTRPILLDTPDALAILPGEEVRAVEAKAIGYMGPEWGEEGTDQIEPAYIIQAMHHLLVLRAVRAASGYSLLPEAVDLPVLFGGREFRIYTVQWDAEFAESIAAECERWWSAHVVAKVPPSLEGSRNAAAWLARKFPRNRGPLLEAARGDDLMAEALHDARHRLEEAERDEATATNYLKQRIGDAEGIAGIGWRITWRTNKKGVRSFRPTWDNETEEAA